MPPNDHLSAGSSPVHSRDGLPGYETADAEPRIIGIIAGIIATGVAFCLLMAGWVYQIHSRETAAEIRQTSFRNGPSQRSSIATDWASLDRENERHLDTYGWIDRPQGVVRVPIARAIDLLVAEAADSPATLPKTKAQP